jgi:hypothetical protein
MASRKLKDLSMGLEHATFNVCVLTDDSLTPEFFAGLEANLIKAAEAAAEEDPRLVLTALESTRSEIPARHTDAWWTMIDRVTDAISAQFDLIEHLAALRTTSTLERPKSELRRWAERWLSNLVQRGGRVREVQSKTVFMQEPGDLRPSSPDSFVDDRTALLNPEHADGSAKVGRAALTFERVDDGQSVLWIEAVRYQDGQIGEHLLMTLSFRRRRFGTDQALGSIADVPLDYFDPY